MPPPREQTLDDAYAEPANFLEIDVNDAKTETVKGKRFTTYAVNVRTNLPVFAVEECTVRRRYSDFDWLRGELERSSKILVPQLPGKALGRQLPWVSEKDGMFSPKFIEERRVQLEVFLNKVAGHPLAQKEKCLHMFLLEPSIDKNYTPGKVRLSKKP